MLALSLLLAASTASASETPPTDCRYPYVGASGEGPMEHRFLPGDGLFRTPIAAMKEARLTTGVRGVFLENPVIAGRADSDRFTAAVISLGDVFGLYGKRRRNGCNGFQLGITGAVFSQFNLDTPSADLINSDFRAGFPFTFRWNALSGRLRLFHQSSHLGDEFVIHNEDVERKDLSFEMLEATLAWGGSWWRLYAGAGVILHATFGMERGMVTVGGELHLRPAEFGFAEEVRGVPVAAVDFSAWAERGWGGTTSVKAGLELSREGSSRRLRFLLVYLGGYTPFGQFFSTNRLENVGFELQYQL